MLIRCDCCLSCPPPPSVLTAVTQSAEQVSHIFLTMVTWMMRWDGIDCVATALKTNFMMAMILAMKMILAMMTLVERSPSLLSLIDLVSTRFPTYYSEGGDNSYNGHDDTFIWWHWWHENPKSWPKWHSQQEISQNMECVQTFVTFAHICSHLHIYKFVTLVTIAHIIMGMFEMDNKCCLQKGQWQ